MSATFERKIRGEIADFGHVSISTAIKIIKYINSLEEKLNETSGSIPQVVDNQKVYIPRHIMDNSFTVVVDYRSDIPAGFYPYREEG